MPITLNGTTGITTPALVNGTALAFRNKIINGNFDIWQRGTSLASGTGGRYLADRFADNSIGSTYTASQQSFVVGQTDVPNNPSFFHRTVVSSVSGNNNFCALQQYIEGVQTLSGTTSTLSFYAKADSAKSISIEFLQYFGIGGTPSPTVLGIGVQKLNLTTSWQKFTVTANIPSIAGKIIGSNNDGYLAITFFFDAGSDFNSRTDNLGQQSGTFDIAQVQLEAGSVATPFENRPIGTELVLCQRYYELVSSSGTGAGALSWVGYGSGGGTIVSGWIQFKATKRTSPTIAIGSTFVTVNLSSQPAVYGQSEAGFSLAAGVVGTGQCSYTVSSPTNIVVASAEL